MAVIPKFMGERIKRPQGDHQQAECRETTVQPYDAGIKGGARIRRDRDARPVDFH